MVNPDYIDEGTIRVYLYVCSLLFDLHKRFTQKYIKKSKIKLFQIMNLKKPAKIYFPGFSNGYNIFSIWT